MRKKLFSYFVIVMMLLTLFPAQAFAEPKIIANGYCGGEGDGTNLTWSLNSEGSLTISGEGKMADYEEISQQPWRSYTDKIKQVVIDKGVTTIGEKAFFSCYYLQQATMSNGVKHIGIGAFMNCFKVKSILLSSGVTNIEGLAFCNCPALDSIFIPSTVTKIDDGNAFSLCDALMISVDENNQSYSSEGGVLFNKEKTKLICAPGGISSSYTIPKGVEKICRYAFSNGITDISIPCSVNLIESYAFEDCSRLTDVYYEGTKNQWKSINLGEQGNKCLTSASIHYDYEIIASGFCGGEGDGTNLTWALDGEGLLDISGSGPMQDYGYDYGYDRGDPPWREYSNQIEEIKIDGATSVGSHAFCAYSEQDYSCLKNVDISNTVTKIGSYAFAINSSFEEFGFGPESLIIPDSVTEIDIYAFCWWTNLTDLTIGESVKRIERGAFAHCNSLSEVSFPDSVEYIGPRAFVESEALTKVKLGKNVSKIGEYRYNQEMEWAFGGCSSLQEIEVSDNNNFFSSIDGVLFSKDHKELILYPFGKGDEYEIPSGVERVGEYAYDALNGLWGGNLFVPISVSNLSGPELSAIYYEGSEIQWENSHFSVFADEIYFNASGLYTIKDDVEPPTTPGAAVTTSRNTVSIKFAWEPSTDNVGVDHYVVFRDGEEIGEATSTSFTDSELEMGTSYEYTLKAVDANGNLSEASEPASLKTATLSFDSYTDFNDTYMMEDQNQYQISLDAAAQYDGDNAALSLSMEYQKEGSEEWSHIPMTEKPSLKKIFVGNWPVKEDGEYLEAGDYTVRFSLTDGYSSISSEPQSVKLIRDNIAPEVQSIISPQSGATYSGSNLPIKYRVTDNIGVTLVTLAYSVGGDPFTEIQSNTHEETKDLTDNYNWDASALASGIYVIKVSVSDAMNNVASSTQEFQIDNTPPEDVTNFAINGTSRYIHLTWNYHSLTTEDDFSKFYIYRSESENGPFSKVREQRSLGYYDDGNTVSADTLYYYYVTAVDKYGNESEGSPVLSAELVADAESPTIGDMLPSDNADLCKSTTLKVTAADNYRLAKAVFTYRLSNSDDWTEIGTVPVANTTNNTEFSYDWDISSLPAGTYQIRASVYDDSINYTEEGFEANAPAVMVRTITIKSYSAPASPALSVVNSFKEATLSWIYNGDESLLRGFTLYRSSSENGNYSIEKTFGSTIREYSVGLPLNGAYFYKIKATDRYNATAESNIVEAMSVGTDTVDPVAVISPEELISAPGLSFQFSGVNSTDNDEIVSYSWNFGDGTTSTSAMPKHTYPAAGDYTVKLTVTDATGNKNTVTKTMSVINTAETSGEYADEYSIVTLKVVDDSSAALTPIANASIWITYGNETTTTALTDANGTATLLMPIGNHTVSVAREGYLSRTKTLKVVSTSDGRMEAVVGLNAVPEVTADLTVSEMTMDEIREAGIDTNDPDNQHVWKCATVFHFALLPDESSTEPTIYDLPVTTGYRNSAGRYTPSSGGWYSYGGTGGSGGSGSGVGSKRVYIAPTEMEGYYLIIYGEAHWLKEMYDVELLVSNNSALDTIQNCTAKLDLPEGLSLAAMLNKQQTESIHLGSVDPNNQAVARWYVRGDQEGEYNLSANLSGKLVNGNVSEDFNYRFNTKDPVKVYAGSALKMTVTADDLAINGETYHVLYRLTNVSHKPMYNLSFEITGYEEGKLIKTTEGDGTGIKKVETFNKDFEGALLQQVDELKPGEYLECDVEVECHFETEDEYASWIYSMFKTSEYEAAYIDLSRHIGSLGVTTMEGSTTTVPSEIIIRTTEKDEETQAIFDRLAKRVSYDPENPDVIILLFPSKQASNTDPQESKSGILQEGDGWALRWKVTYYVDANGRKYDPQLEIYMDGEDLSDSFKFSISLTDPDPAPWLTATGFVKDDFVKVSVRGTNRNPIHIVNNQFKGYTSVKTVDLLNIITIDTSTFEGCSSLEIVNGLNEKLNSIASGAFKNCSKLTTITGKATNLMNIGADAFQNTKVSSFDLGEKITDLNAKAFEGCGSLQSITIPVSLKTVGESAFSGCNNLQDVYYSGSKASWRSISIATGNEPLLAATIHYNVSDFDKLFLSDPSSYNNDIAIITAKLSDGTYSADGETAKALLKEYGFEENQIKSGNYEHNTSDDGTLAFVMATKEYDGLDADYITVIAAQGSTNPYELVKDATAQPSRTYSGNGGTYSVYDIVDDFYSVMNHTFNPINGKKYKVVLTGHSLGGV